MRHRVLLAAVLAGLLELFHVAPASAQSLVAAVLPASRSVQVLTPATAFVTIINSGTATASAVSISPQNLSSSQAILTYQTTDPSTNQVTGSPNTPVDIAAGQSQSFVISITPLGALLPTDVTFNFAGTNTPPVAPIVGVNTLLLTATTTPTPDVIALAATAPNDGIVRIPGVTGSGAFSVASSNVGATGNVLVSADTGSTALPVTINVCQTNPQTGQCTSAIGPTVPVQIATGATPTFAVFVTGSAFMPFDPAHNRVFVRFRTILGGLVDVTVGSTSVAIQTSLVGTYQGNGTATLSSCRLPSNNGTSAGTFTATVDHHIGNTISGTFTLSSSSSTTRVNYSVMLSPTGEIPGTPVSFTVSVFGFPVGSGTATLTGQITGDTVEVSFSGQLQGIESCNVVGMGTATRT